MYRSLVQGIAALAGVALLAPGALAEEHAPAPAQETAPTEEETVSTESATDPALAAIDRFIAEQAIAKSGSWKQQLNQPPKVEFAEGKTYVWELDTSQGPIEIELMPEVAPMHVSSTIYLTRLGFYDGVIFHRVIPGFMAQGGDPTGSGRGGPGYTYSGEFDPLARHDKRGILSMAHAGPGTDGSQFFITFGPTPHLDRKHTVFGTVVGGADTLDKLEAQGTSSGAPKEKLEIRKAAIRVQ